MTYFPHPDNDSPIVPRHIRKADYDAYAEVNQFSVFEVPRPKEPDLEDMPQIRREMDRIRKVARDCPPVLWNALIYFMKYRNITVDELADSSSVSTHTISKCRTDPDANPTLECILSFCIGMNLHPDLAYALIKTTKYNIWADRSDYAMYRYLIRYHHMETLEAWNKRLEYAGFTQRLPR